MARVLTVKQIIDAMRERGQCEQAETFWGKIRPHFADSIADDEVLQLTVDEAAFLIRIDVLMGGSDADREEAFRLIAQVYERASMSVDPELISAFNRDIAGNGQTGEGVFQSVGDYVKSLWKRGFSVDY